MFDLIKQQVSLISELEKDLGTTFRPMGDKNWIIEDRELEGCPFCGHKDCFRVHYQEGENASSFYKCFSCGEHGDVITWRAKWKKIEVKDAARELAQEHGIKLPNDYNPIQQVFTLAAAYYHTCLLETCNRPFPALGGLTPTKYQLEVRQRKPETLEKYKLGFSDGGLISYLEGLGVDPEIIEASGLANKKTGKDFLPSNVFIYPHFVKGRVSHFTFKDPLKRVQYQLPKKYSLNGYLFYGQDTFAESDDIFLVEGENDRLAMLETGICPSVLAIIGQISGEQLDWLRENGKKKRIITVFDPDDAGDKYREKTELLRKFFRTLAHVRPPEDKDIDELLISGKNLIDLVKENLVKVEVSSGPIKAPSPWEDIVPISETVRDESGPEAPKSTFTSGAGLISSEVEVLGPARGYQPPSELEDDADSKGYGRELSSKEDSSESLVELEDCNVIQKHGCYYKVTYKEGVPDYVRISDFILELKNIFEDESPDGQKDRLREVVIRRQDGMRSSPFLIDSETKCTVKSFKVLVAKYSDCEWRGRDADLDNMWKLVYTQCPDTLIKTPRIAGRLDAQKSWVFKNVLITDSGVIIKPDDNGVFWTSGKSQGLRPQPISTSGENDGIPRLEMDLTREQCKEMLATAATHLARTLGSPGAALTALGWIHSNIYSDPIFKKNGGMGLLMLSGYNGGGKSTIASWLQSFFGLTEKMASTSITQLKSAVGFQRLGEFYSCLPLYLDEFRNDEASLIHLGMIRAWYDREGRTIAMGGGVNIRTQKIRSTLMIGGEDLPVDPATRERCVAVAVPQISRDGKDSKEGYNWFQANKHLFSNITYYWILDAAQENVGEVMKGIGLIDDDLSNRGCSKRISKVWAAAGYFGQQMAKEIFPDFDFVQYLVDTCMKEQKQQKGDSTLSQFFELIEIMQAQEHSKITDKHVMYDPRTKHLHIWYMAVFREIIDSEKGRFKFSKNMVLRGVKEEPYFVSDDKKIAMGLDGERKTVLTLDVTKAPDVIKRIAKYDDGD